MQLTSKCILEEGERFLWGRCFLRQFRSNSQTNGESTAVADLVENRAILSVLKNDFSIEGRWTSLVEELLMMVGYHAFFLETWNGDVNILAKENFWMEQTGDFLLVRTHQKSNQQVSSVEVICLSNRFNFLALVSAPVPLEGKVLHLSNSW